MEAMKVPAAGSHKMCGMEGEIKRIKLCIKNRISPFIGLQQKIKLTPKVEGTFQEINDFMTLFIPSSN
jgi:hypothetical protein